MSRLTVITYLDYELLHIKVSQDFTDNPQALSVWYHQIIITSYVKVLCTHNEILIVTSYNTHTRARTHTNTHTCAHSHTHNNNSKNIDM